MIARDAYPYILIPTLGAVGLLIFGWPMTAVILVGLAVFMAFFFRDPERQIPSDEWAVVSPADGKVVGVVTLDPNNAASPTRLSIFLSVFDVHINRSPMAGQIKDVAFHAGQFKVAFAEDASLVNEQSVITLERDGIEIIFKQIAGLLARRIVFTKHPGDWVAKGERVGLIKFGSRVDVIFPPEVTVMVQKGERVQGGSSVIGRIHSCRN
jgi:phosphatidylserine decarboxylase